MWVPGILKEVNNCESLWYVSLRIWWTSEHWITSNLATVWANYDKSPRQNGRHFPDSFKWIFLNGNACRDANCSVFTECILYFIWKICALWWSPQNLYFGGAQNLYFGVFSCIQFQICTAFICKKLNQNGICVSNQGVFASINLL